MRPTGVARRPVRLGLLALAAGLVLAVGLILAAPAAPARPRAAALAAGASPSLAADPYATAAAVGDPRSSGEGAGLVGAPLFAIGGMLAVGLLATAGTLLYVRVTGGPRRG